MAEPKPSEPAKEVVTLTAEQIQQIAAEAAQKATAELTTRINELESELENAKLARAESDEEAKAKIEAESKKAAEDRIAEIEADPKLTDKQKQILKLHEQGKQMFAIAQEVYEVVAKETVGKVAMVIQNHYATDLDEIKKIDEVKGYTGF